MSTFPQCVECQEKFNKDTVVPYELDCKHPICEECAFSQQRKYKTKMVCNQCKVETNKKARELPEFEEIVQIITRRTQFSDDLRNEVSSIIKQTQDNKVVIHDIYQIQKNIVQKLLLSLQGTLFSSSNAFLQNLQSFLENSEENVQKLESIIKRLDEYDMEALGMQNIIRLESQKASQEQEQKSKQMIIKMEKIETTLYTEMEQFLKEFCEKSNLQWGSYLQSEYAEVEERTLKQKENYQKMQELKSLQTVKESSQIKLEFKIQEKQFQESQIDISQTNLNYTQVEQIGENKLVISGGYDEHKDHFLIFDNGNINQYKMQQGRNFHRTVFDQWRNVYILSGQYNYQQYIQQCEFYNMANQQFTQIKDIGIPVESFGAFMDQTQHIYVFGGFVDIIKLSNKVQVYDIEKNEWIKNICLLPNKSLTSAGYLSSTKSGLIFNNFSISQYQIDTWIYDFKDIKKHGEKFLGECEVFCQPVAINNKVYQFDRTSSLFVYSLETAAWEKIQQP